MISLRHTLKIQVILLISLIRKEIEGHQLAEYKIYQDMRHRQEMDLSIMELKEF